MKLTLKDNISYQQILLDYFTNKITDEDKLSEVMKQKGLKDDYVYRKTAYATISVRGIMESIGGIDENDKLQKLIFSSLCNDECVSVPLYFSANEIKLVVLSGNDVEFEKSISQLFDKFNSSFESAYGVFPETEVKSIFSTLKELKINLCLLMFDNFKTTKTESRLILNAKMYVEKNYMNKISLKDIAEHLGITTYYFCRVFKKETGVNFANYLNEVRINQAKKLLRETKLNNRAICERVGINSTNYFHQIFKSCTGMTPSEFKRVK